MDKIDHYIYRKERLMADLNIGKFNQRAWVDFINDARKDGMSAMAHDMEQRYTFYLRKVRDGK